jgi:hypothetical protein
VKATAEPLDAVRPPPSIAYVRCGEGIAQVVLLRKGLATTSEMLSSFVTAQAAAKKEKCGYWGIKR